MSLKQIVANVKSQQDLIVTPRLDKWLVATEGRLVLSDENAEWLAELLSEHPRDRSKSWSASGVSGCQRAQQFAYFGVKQKRGFDSRLNNIFMDGHWRHLRWQFMCLEADILDDIEVSYFDKYLNLKGSLDGIGHVPSTGVFATHKYKGRQFGWELKGTHGYNFNAVWDRGEPLADHVVQTHGYMYLSGLDLFSIIYEHKNNQEWKEFIIERDESIIEHITELLEELQALTDEESLVKVLPACQQKQGPYKGCPYAWTCLQVQDVKDLRMRKKKRAVRRRASR